MTIYLEILKPFDMIDRKNCEIRFVRIIGRGYDFYRVSEERNITLTNITMEEYKNRGVKNE